MSMKNIRNSSNGMINIHVTDPNSFIPSYQNSGLIPLTWDANDLLQGGPYTSNIICEKIGKMVFIKVTETITGTPQGAAALFWSPAAIVPAAYRPTVKSYSSALVVNGYVDPLTPLLQMIPGSATIMGGCYLDIDGTLSFGTGEGPRIPGPLQTNGTLNTFNGPNNCGIMKQTLTFSLE